MTTKPPIRQWRIRNLKAVEKANLDLAYLTVLVGSNSSGKSTVLQSILLAVQAAQAQTQGDVFPLNGLLAQLGEFKDAHSAFTKSTSSSIGGIFGLPTGVRGETSILDWKVEFRGSDRSQVGSTKLVSAYVSARSEDAAGKHRHRATVEAAARPRKSSDLPLLLGASTTSRINPTDQTIVRWPGTVKLDSSKPEVTQGLNLVAGFATHYLREADEHEELTERWITRAATTLIRWRPLGARDEVSARGVGDYKSAELTKIAVRDIQQALANQAASGLWPDQIEFRELAQATLRNALGRSLRDALGDPETVEAIRTGIRAALGPGRRVIEPESIPGGMVPHVLRLLAEGVTYLGPLRQEPQVVYRTYSPAHPRNLGTKGEYTAPVMYRLRNETVTVPLPGGRIEKVTLQAAVNAWLGELGAASSIEVRDAGRLGYDVRVEQPGLPKSVDLTSVGVGVSQVVPVVLACLLAEPGGVILLEQPELHLHPAMQQRLADFFLAIANSGRQLIIETHSEYLITRLRLRVAEDRTNHVADQLCFINASKKGPRTEFKQVSVNRYGNFEDWPEGFFDQAAEDSQALLIEGLKKKAGD